MVFRTAHFMPGRSKDKRNIRKQKQKFPKLVKDIIRTSDVVLEILDARFVEETRNREIEKEIERQGKKIIYVLNKADLVDISKTRKGLDKKMREGVFVSSKERRGIGELRDKIKMEVKKVDLGNKERAQVGIIGYPNTGKSSLINTLTGRSSAKTGAQAGFTKGIQKISLTKNILVLDTPGVIPDAKYSHSKKEAVQEQVKIGARTLDTIKEPDMIVLGLMQDYAEQIENFYGVNVDGDAEKLIELLGKEKGFLKKGGIVDEDRTARMIIKDWQAGKIKVG